MVVIHIYFYTRQQRNDTNLNLWFIYIIYIFFQYASSLKIPVFNQDQKKLLIYIQKYTKTDTIKIRKVTFPTDHRVHRESIKGLIF